MTAFTRFLVHAWWTTLALSGALRLLSTAVQLVVGTRLLDTFAGFFDLVGFSCAALGWLMVAITPRLPARVAIPLLAAQTWLMLGAMPFGLLAFGTPWLSLCYGLIYLVAVALSMGMARTLGPGLGLNEAALDKRPQYHPLRSVAWVGSSFTIAPALVVTYLVSTSAWMVSYGTGDYVRLNAQGLSFARKTFVQDDRTVDLIAMVHLGEQEAYDTLFGPVRGIDDAVVLSEGVSDSEGLLSDIGESYAGAAENLGLTVQKPMNDLTGLRDQNADVDVNTFDPITLELLGIILRLYDGKDNRSDMLAYLSFWSDHQNDANEILDQLFEDILYSRNDHLIAEIEACDVNHIVVPWGALHMAEVGPGLEARGWTHQHTERIVLIRWTTLLAAI